MRKITGRCFALGLLVLAALVSGVYCAGKEDSINPESLIAQARKLEEIWTDGTPPITMRTEIHVLDAKGKVTPGQYVVTWQSSSRWREELEIANRRVSTTLRQVLTEFSEFFICSIKVSSFHKKFRARIA